jgi:preprotein translocase subunit SecG
MYQVIIVVHVLLGLGIIGLVLMQHGKGADAGAAFGSGSSGSVFGAQGAASFLSRATAILATLFFLTSLGLAFLTGNTGEPVDIMDAPEISEVPLTENVPQAPPAADLPVVTESLKDAEVVVKETAEEVSQQAQQATESAVDAVKKVVE